MKKIKVWIMHGIDPDAYYDATPLEGSIGLLGESSSISETFEGAILYGPTEDIIYEFNETGAKMGFTRGKC